MTIIRFQCRLAPILWLALLLRPAEAQVAFRDDPTLGLDSSERLGGSSLFLPAYRKSSDPFTAWGGMQTFDQAQSTFDAQVDDAPRTESPDWFQSDHEDFPGRYAGLGDPLVGTSWRNRPLHIGWLVGGLYGDDLSAGETKLNEDLIGGYRLGWDFDHYWGTEARFAFSNIGFVDESEPDSSRTARNHYLDINLLHYPWGDSRWRPFGSIGVGWASFEYVPADNQPIEETLLTFPIAIGMKYYFRNWMAVRLTATDNWAIGRSELDTMHNFSVTADVEIRFGGRRPSYFPYNGAIHPW